MSDISVSVEGLGKRYRINRHLDVASTAAGRLRAIAKAPFRYALSLLRQPSPDEILWAIRDVSFELRQGEIACIMGTNGSGKSTLLKILSRVTRPTEGKGALTGRVGALLEVGTGFHPDLTGRENIDLNGSILGMRTAEIRTKLDEIIAFSEIGDFLDTPVKHYSSGMRVRLGFSVAASLQTDILILDEVLAVGDMGFRQKCYARIAEMLGDGRTVIIVGHDTSRTEDLIRRGIWLKNGRIVADGDYSEILERYTEDVIANAAAAGPLTSQDGSLTISSVRVLNEAGTETEAFSPGEGLMLEVRYSCTRTIATPEFGITIASAFAPLFAARQDMDGSALPSLSGSGSIRCVFACPHLMPGQRYRVRLSVTDAGSSTVYIPKTEVAAFAVKGDPADLGFAGRDARRHLRTHPPIRVPYTWVLPDGSTRQGARPITEAT